MSEDRDKRSHKSPANPEEYLGPSQTSVNKLFLRIYLTTLRRSSSTYMFEIY